ncbi:hypothetical protein EV421DRAFT_1737815 [Armillaria borealis]|uniref:Uncharacterized protein n=1 Tax=Armillaria borealis TaxID=47425 RepID=A0AA39JBE3_9AGAR|nr:hypothetical protein EV421DRAFT_1737815 [Armillaria borealis]
MPAAVSKPMTANEAGLRALRTIREILWQSDLPGAIREPMTAMERRHLATTRKERRSSIRERRVCRETRAYDCSDCKGTQVSGYCKQSGTRFGAKDMPGAIREPMTATKRRHQGTARKERRDLITKPHVFRRTVVYDCNGTPLSNWFKTMERQGKDSSPASLSWTFLTSRLLLERVVRTKERKPILRYQESDSSEGTCGIKAVLYPGADDVAFIGGMLFWAALKSPLLVSMPSLSPNTTATKAVPIPEMGAEFDKMLFQAATLRSIATRFFLFSAQKAATDSMTAIWVEWIHTDAFIELSDGLYDNDTMSRSYFSLRTRQILQ